MSNMKISAVQHFGMLMLLLLSLEERVHSMAISVVPGSAISVFEDTSSGLVKSLGYAR